MTRTDSDRSLSSPAWAPSTPTASTTTSNPPARSNARPMTSSCVSSASASITSWSARAKVPASRGEVVAVTPQQEDSPRIRRAQPAHDGEPDLGRPSDQQDVHGATSPVRTARSERHTPSGSTRSRTARQSSSRGYMARSTSGRRRASLLR